jgi:hypothetical protein
MRVRALGAFCIGGGVDVARGDVFDVEDAVATGFIYAGHVEVAPPPKAARQDPEPKGPGDGDQSAEHPGALPGALAGGSPRPEHREPEPARGARGGGSGR